DGTKCTLPGTGCYNGIITITNDPNTLLYYDNQGGTEDSNAYDFYGTVQHETDELLGTGSCITTGSGGQGAQTVKLRARAVSAAASADQPSLTDYCGDGVPSAVDLYRYSGAGKLVLDSDLSTKDGAYFSYDGGTTKGAPGVDGRGKDYNTKANGADYADFVSSADCATVEAIQDAFGCAGQDAGLNILNDGKGEINILNALGYNLVTPPTQYVTANKTLINFGKVTFKAMSSKTDGIDLRNDTTTAATVGPISIVATYGDLSQFTFDSSKCPTPPATLDPGKSCHVDVTFTPDAVQVSRATLKIPTSPGSTLSIPLTGTGIADVTQ
ncbi:MAG: hypothetical protein JO022_06295, partial [Acidobacteriaceae bacterium]|nr:hypothetical protein [Acidobacteriaceae bacterium]